MEAGNSGEDNLRTEIESTMSEQDFEDITQRVENSVSKRVKETQDSQREIMKILAEMKAQISQITTDKTGETALSDKENVPPNEIPAQCSSRSRDANVSSNTNAEELPQSTPPQGGCNTLPPIFEQL